MARKKSAKGQISLWDDEPARPLVVPTDPVAPVALPDLPTSAVAVADAGLPKGEEENETVPTAEQPEPQPEPPQPLSSPLGSPDEPKTEQVKPVKPVRRPNDLIRQESFFHEPIPERIVTEKGEVPESVPIVCEPEIWQPPSFIPLSQATGEVYLLIYLNDNINRSEPYVIRRESWSFRLGICRWCFTDDTRWRYPDGRESNWEVTRAEGVPVGYRATIEEGMAGQAGMGRWDRPKGGQDGYERFPAGPWAWDGKGDFGVVPREYVL